MSQNNPLSSVIDFLLQPVPFLPDGSFITGQSMGPRRKQRKPLPSGRGRTGSKNPSRPQASSGITVAGIIQRGNEAPYSVGGQDFEITPDTWVFGDVRYGVTATVQLVRTPGSTYARKIIIQ